MAIPDGVTMSFEVKSDPMSSWFTGFNPKPNSKPWTFTFTPTGGTKVYIDPKTLKPCKHRWYPDIQETAGSWTITPQCDRCGVTGSPKDKGVSLAKLVKQLG